MHARQSVRWLVAGAVGTICIIVLTSCIETEDSSTGPHLFMDLRGPEEIEVKMLPGELEGQGSVELEAPSAPVKVRNVELEPDADNVMEPEHWVEEDEVTVGSETLWFTVIGEHPGDDKHYETVVTFETNAETYRGDILRERGEIEFNEVKIRVVTPPPDEE